MPFYLLPLAVFLLIVAVLFVYALCRAAARADACEWPDASAESYDGMTKPRR